MIDLLARAYPLSALGVVVAAETAPLVGDACSLNGESIGTLIVQILGLIVAWFIGIERGRRNGRNGSK